MPEFVFNWRSPRELYAKWNHKLSETLVINNQTITHFSIKLIEFQDLDSYKKAVHSYQCDRNMSSPNSAADMAHHYSHSDTKSYCNDNPEKSYIFGRVDNYSPRDVLMSNESDHIFNFVQSKAYRTNRFLEANHQNR